MKNREFLYQSGEPVEPERVREFEAKERLDLMERFKKDPEMEGVLGRVKFDVLRSIFARYAKKVGIAETDLNILNADYIHSGTLIGEYQVGENLIALSSKGIEKGYAGFAGFRLDLAILKMLTHEETHAVSGARILGYHEYQKEQRKEDYHVEKQSGYQRFFAKGKWKELPSKSQRLFSNFNEGIVEKLSQEVFLQYLEEDTDFAGKKDGEIFIQQLKENPAFLSYEKEVALVDALVLRLAKEIEVPKEIIWRSFVRGLFEAERFEDEEMHKAFSEMFSEDFVKRLSTFSSNEEYRQLLDEIKAGPIAKVPKIFSSKISEESSK